LSADQGDKVRFNHILAMGGKDQAAGTPLIAGAYVDAEIISQTKGEKTINFVKRRRKHSSQRKKGHRQDLTILKVLEIKSDQKIDETNNFEILGKVLKQAKSTSNTKENREEKIHQ
jgi:ribosomal protein L21